MIKTILIDVDGVIADFDTHALVRLVGSDKDVHYARLNRPKGEWSIAKGLGITEEQFWLRVDDTSFWETIPVMPGAVDFVRTLYKMAREHYNVHSFYFCTASGGSTSFPNARTKWIREFNKATGVQIPLIIVQTSGAKALCANAETLLIDDNDKGYESFLDAGGYGVLVPRQWNRGQHNPALGSVYDQVIDEVRRGLSGLSNTAIDI